MSTPVLRDFLEIPYEQLEEMNLGVKQARLKREPADKLREARLKYLTDERRIKAVTVCFTDLEGRLHMLDYDKKFLLKSQDNLTFDGSSVRGFSAQHESDLRLNLDWSAFYWLPSDVFGPGKVLVFSEVLGRDGSPYAADLRSKLKLYTEALHRDQGMTCHVAPEIEGFLFNGKDAERRYNESGRFEYVSTGGYYHSLPVDKLRRFIDAAAEGSGRWASRTRRTTPRWPPASSR
jgi:glutamine synthetase